MKKTTPSPDKPSTSDLLQLLQEIQSSGTTRGEEAVVFSSATWTPANRDNKAFYKQIQEVCRSFQPGTVYELETALPGLIKQIVRAIISSGSSRENLISPSLRNGAFDESCAIQMLSDSLSQLSVHKLIAIEQRAPGTILTLAQCAAAKTGSSRPLDALSETLLALTDWEAFTPENTLNTMIWFVKASQKDPNCPNLHAITLHACSLLTRDHFNSLVEKMPDLIPMLFELAQHDRPESIPARTTAEYLLARVFTAYTDLGHAKWIGLQQKSPGMMNSILSYLLYVEDASSSYNSGVTFVESYLQASTGDALILLGENHPTTLTSFALMAMHYPAILDLITSCQPNLVPNELTALELKNPGFLQHFVDAARHHQHADAMAWVAAWLSGLKKTPTLDDFRDIERNAPGTMMHLFTAARSSEGKRLLPVLAGILKAQQGSIKLHAIEKGAPGTIKSIAAITKRHRDFDAYRILSDLSRLLTQAPILRHALEIERRAPGTIKQFAKAVSIDDADILASRSTEELDTWAYQAPIDAMTHPDLLGQLSYDDWLEIERNTPGTIMYIALCASRGHPLALQQLTSKLAEAPYVNWLEIEDMAPKTIRYIALCVFRGHSSALEQLVSELANVPSDTLLSLEERAPETIKNLLYNAFKKGDLATSILTLFARVGHDFTAENLFTIETDAPGTLTSLAHASMRNNPSAFWAITPKLAQLSREQLYSLVCHPQAPNTLRKLVKSLDENQSDFALALALCIDRCLSPNEIFTLETSRFGKGTVATLANSAMSNNFPVLWEALANKLLQFSPENLQRVEEGHANTLSSIRDAADHFDEPPVSRLILNQFSQLLPQPAVNLAGPAADAIRFFGSTPFDMEGLEDQPQPASSHSP